MIPPEVSRRLAQVFNEVPFEHRREILAEVEKVKSWVELPLWIREFVVKLENDSLVEFHKGQTPGMGTTG